MTDALLVFGESGAAAGAPQQEPGKKPCKLPCYVSISELFRDLSMGGLRRGRSGGEADLEGGWGDDHGLAAGGMGERLACMADAQGARFCGLLLLSGCRPQYREALSTDLPQWARGSPVRAEQDQSTSGAHSAATDLANAVRATSISTGTSGWWLWEGSRPYSGSNTPSSGPRISTP